MTSHQGHTCHPSLATEVAPFGTIETWCAGCGIWLGGGHTTGTWPTASAVLDAYAEHIIDELAGDECYPREDVADIAHHARRIAWLFLVLSEPGTQLRDRTGMNRNLVFSADDYRYLGTASEPHKRDEIVLTPELWREAVDDVYKAAARLNKLRNRLKGGGQ